jgi:HK97 family phage major capsid protein
MPKGVIERAASAVGTTIDPVWAKPLATMRDASEEFIDLLRPASVFARVPARRMNFDRNSAISIPRQTAGASGAWVGEGAAIPVKKLAFDAITLSPRKLAVIVGVTNELLSHSSPAVDAIIRDDMIRSTASYLDTCFTDAVAGSASRPAGLQTYATAPIVSSGSTLADITADIAAATGAMMAANVPMARPVWIMNPANMNALQFVRDGLGTYAFRSEVIGGTLNGYPIISSTAVPADVVMLVDADCVVIADDLAPTIDLSEEAVLHVEDTTPAEDMAGASPVRSLWQTDSVAMRLRYRLDWGVRQAAGVQSITGVAWSAAA